MTFRQNFQMRVHVQLRRTRERTRALKDCWIVVPLKPYHTSNCRDCRPRCPIAERRVLTDVNTSLCAYDRKDTVTRIGFTCCTHTTYTRTSNCKMDSTISLIFITISPNVVFATVSCEHTKTDLNYMSDLTVTMRQRLCLRP